MTDGRRHRLVLVGVQKDKWVMRVMVRVQKDKWVMRVMRHPLYHSADLPRVDASPYPYGVCPQTDPRDPTCWTLSALGILHRWTGLTLYYEEEDQ